VTRKEKKGKEKKREKEKEEKKKSNSCETYPIFLVNDDISTTNA
jgi:hypothetical protein